MSYGLSDTVGALTALKTKLEAIQYQAAPAFGKVAMFDMTNLQVALMELLTASSRVCLIVHDVETFETKKNGQSLDVRQSRELSLLVADRHFANRQIALFGDGDKTPGALKLKDLILNNVLGMLQSGMYCEPIHGEQLVLEQTIRDQLNGRVGFILGLRLVGGNVTIPLSRQPIP